MKYDSLDMLLNDERVTDNEWYALAKALDVNPINNNTRLKKAEIINKELRHSFGHTIVNISRSIYEPDYIDPILKEVIKFCKIEGLPIRCTAEDIEEAVYNKITSAYKDTHPIEWKQCKYKELDYFSKLIDIGKDQKSLLSIVGDVAIGGGVGTGIFYVMAKKFNPLVAVGTSVNTLCFDTNWRKVIPAILIVSVIRKRLKLCDVLNCKR